MPKYYVQCEDLKVVLNAPTSKQAATIALANHIKDGMVLNPHGIYVNEIGFSSLQNKHKRYNVKNILLSLGFEFE